MPQTIETLIERIRKEIQDLMPEISEVSKDIVLEDEIKKYIKNYYDVNIHNINTIYDLFKKVQDIGDLLSEVDNSNLSTPPYEKLSEINNRLNDYKSLPSKLSDQLNENILYFYQLILYIIILLYQRGYLAEFEKNPKNFIRNILSVTLSDFNDLKNDYEIKKQLYIELNRIKPKDWQNFKRAIPKIIIIYYWSTFDNDASEEGSNVNENGTLKTLLEEKGALREYIKNINNASMYYPKPSSNEPNSDYQNYFKSISSALQEEVDQPDIIFMDSSYIADYKSKGAIISLSSIKSKSEILDFIDELNYDEYSGNNNSENTLEKLGKTTNGTLDAVPITRNFHLPATAKFDSNELENNKTILSCTIFQNKNNESITLGELLKGFRTKNGKPELIYYDDLFSPSNLLTEYIDAKLVKSKDDFSIRMNYISLLNTCTEKEVIDKDKSNPNEICAFTFKSNGKNDCKYNRFEIPKERNSLKDYSKSFKELDDFSFLDMGDAPFIPMQLAKGAHIVYTIYAYLSNINEKMNSFIASPNDEEKIEKNESIVDLVMLDLEKQDNHDNGEESVKSAITKFYKLIFKYVPIISFASDQIVSSKIREKKHETWFDLCLPIEAPKFHKRKHESSEFEIGEIEYKSKPLLRKTTAKPLSCLGGFVLTVSKNSKDISGSITLVENLVKLYFWNSFQDISRQDINSRIKTKEKSTDLPESDYRNKVKEKENETKKDSRYKNYIETPKSLSKRPNIQFWHSLENIISHSFRLHIMSLFIYRLLLLMKNDGELLEKDESLKQYKIAVKNNPHSTESLLEEEDISRIISKFTTIIIKKLGLEEDSENILDNESINLKSIIENNFNLPINDKVYIKDFINKELMRRSTVEEFIDNLSLNTLKILNERIKDFENQNNINIQRI